MTEKVMVTGGCGYVGSVLVSCLLERGHEVSVVDNQWFGNYLADHRGLKIIKRDIRELNSSDFAEVKTVIHLANIANDPAVDLNPVLSWEVNVLAMQHICWLSEISDVEHLIYASSGSVYGLSDWENVTEECPLLPISVYNKTKMCAERIALSYSAAFKVQVVRPATVCGLSPRMRLDVAVNLLTFQALTKGMITVLGGDQTRPNIHISDMVQCYIFLMNNSDVESGVFNAGFENLAIIDVARLIQEECEASITIEKSNDPRSYRQDSSKLVARGFNPKFGVVDAIKEIKKAFMDGRLLDAPEWHTVKMMQTLRL